MRLCRFVLCLYNVDWVRRTILRITSYNVCYTKLLRSNASSKFLTGLSEKKKPNILPLTSVTNGIFDASAAFLNPSMSFFALFPSDTYNEGLDLSFLRLVRRNNFV